VILGVDRLDCIKGIPQKLHAFDTLLERRPDLIGEVTLLQVAVPSRDDLKSHQDLKEEIQHLVGEVNGKYGMSPYLSAEVARSRVINTYSRTGKVNYVPVQFLYTSIAPDELTALYAAADVCFVSSVRDGMNLVCYEFIASRKPGIVEIHRSSNASRRRFDCESVEQGELRYCFGACVEHESC
jgi:trehalose-6-phosphate synthase